MRGRRRMYMYPGPHLRVKVLFGEAVLVPLVTELPRLDLRETDPPPKAPNQARGNQPASGARWGQVVPKVAAWWGPGGRQTILHLL